MNNIIFVNFLKRQVVDESSVGSLARKIEYTPKCEWESLQERIRARFGDNQPTRLDFLWSRTWDEPYKDGCVHNVAYRSALKSKNWNRPYPFPVKVDPDTAEIGKSVRMGGTDPLMWMDYKYKSTLKHIETRRGKSLKINTRSDLIAHDDYIFALDRDNHEIYIHVNNFNSDVGRLLEPGCPSVNRRLSAYQKLKDRGFKVFLVLDTFDCKVPKSWIEKHPFELEINSTNTIKLGKDQIKNISIQTGVLLSK